jgi:hypothetical protein
LVRGTGSEVLEHLLGEAVIVHAELGGFERLVAGKEAGRFRSDFGTVPARRVEGVRRRRVSSRCGVNGWSRLGGKSRSPGLSE